MAELSVSHPTMLVWLDETGFQVQKLNQGIQLQCEEQQAKSAGKEFNNAIAVMSMKGVEDVYLS